MKYILMLSLMPLLSSCTNMMIRQQCEKVNWYQHASDVAMSGKRLDGDEQITKCRKAEYDLPEQQIDVGFKDGMDKYCRPEIVETTGRHGDFFNMDLCDPGKMSYLKSRHAAGVRVYCAVDNGFAAGASGKKYQNICPAEMEKAFLKEYGRGRRQFLTNQIATDHESIRALDSTIVQLQSQEQGLQFRRNIVMSSAPPFYPGENDADRMAREQQVRNEIDSQRFQIDNEIAGLERQIQEIRTKQDALHQEIDADQSEIISLGDGH